MTHREAYLAAILERATKPLPDVIEDAIRANTFARQVRGESPTPLNRRTAIESKHLQRRV